MKIKNFTEKNSWIWPLLGVIVLWIAIGAFSGGISLKSLFSGFSLASFILLLALAQMFVVTSGKGAIDLSTVYIMTFAAFVSCTAMQKNIFLGFLAAVVSGIIFGAINGIINVYLKIPAMITTLATGYIIYTFVLITASSVTNTSSQAIAKFINTTHGGISNLTIICVVIAAILGIVLYKTKYGRQLHAVGQNRNAARYAGIQVNKVLIITFAISGAISGFAGVLCASYVGGAFRDMGEAYFLPSIAATFIGGTLAAGGKSSTAGTVFGAFMMSLLTTLLNVTRLSPGLQKLIQGAILVLILIASVNKKAGEK